MVEEKKFYEKLWFAWVMLILVAPIGIYLMFKYKHHQIVGRSIASVVFGLFFLYVVITGGDTDETTSTEVESETVEAEATEEKSEEDEESDSTETEEDTDNEPAEETEEEEVEEPEEEPKEELFVDLVSADYDAENDRIVVQGETNIQDGVEIYASLDDGSDDILSSFMPDSAIIENGTFTVHVGEWEDEYEKEFVYNGDFDITVSISSLNNEVWNDYYGTLDEFNESYALPDGPTARETDDGFIVENWHIGSTTITGALSKEEAEAKEDEIYTQSLKEQATTIDYAQLEKNPDRHVGEYVTYTGEIVQIMEDADFTVIRLAVTETSYGYDFNDIIWVEYDGLTDFVNEDIVTIYGMIYGTHSYTSTAGWDISLPAVIADVIE